jgi:hypothetical protein
VPEIAILHGLARTDARKNPAAVAFDRSSTIALTMKAAKAQCFQEH